jgi:hypothetical protein
MIKNKPTFNIGFMQAVLVTLVNCKIPTLVAANELPQLLYLTSTTYFQSAVVINMRNTHWFLDFNKQIL